MIASLGLTLFLVCPFPPAIVAERGGEQRQYPVQDVETTDRGLRWRVIDPDAFYWATFYLLSEEKGKLHVVKKECNSS